MSYNNYVDADAAWRTVHDFDRARGGHHQARQPVRHRGRRRHRRRAPPAHACDPVSAFGGVIAANRRGDRRRWPSRSPRSSPRWSWHPSFEDGALEILAGQEEPAGAASRPAWQPVDGGVAPDQRRRARCRPPTASTPPATTRPPGSSSPARRRRAEVLDDLVFAWRAVRAVKSNAILLARERRQRRRRHGPGQPGRLGAAGGVPGRRARRGLGRRVRRFFPFPDGLRGPDRRRAWSRSSSRAARCATSMVIEAADGGRHHDVPSPAPGTSTTEGGRKNDAAARSWTARRPWRPSRTSSRYGSRRSPTPAVRPGWARSWSATTRARRPTSTASTATAPTSASSRSAGTCRRRHPGRCRGGGRRAQRRPGLHRLPRAAAAAARLRRAARCSSGSTRPRTPTACTR